MERMIQKLAQQLNEYDESSLMQLWHTYATQVLEFEPTKKWEEAAISLCLVQAVRWKNQLFNYNLANQSTYAADPSLAPFQAYQAQNKEKAATHRVQEDTIVPQKNKKKATLLSFPQPPISSPNK